MGGEAGRRGHMVWGEERLLLVPLVAVGGVSDANACEHGWAVCRGVRASVVLTAVCPV
jgi:hypothetical protein